MNQWLTATEAAAKKKMSLNRFKYQMSKPGAPQPVLVGVGQHRFYRPAEIEAWRPESKTTKGRKTK